MNAAWIESIWKIGHILRINLKSAQIKQKFIQIIANTQQN